MSKIGIVYATGSKMIRRIIIPDNDKQLDLPGWIGEGETLLVVPKHSDDDPANPGHIHYHIKQSTGIDPPDPTCVLIDDATNEVVKIIAADPDIDRVDGHTLVRGHQEIGAKFNRSSKQFILPQRPLGEGHHK